MNIIYRLIWSVVGNALVAVAEKSRIRGKGSSAGAASVAATLLVAVTCPVPAIAAPGGAVVTAGAASIEQSGPVTTIAQGSKNLSLNWNSFNIGSAETVNFLQPSAGALAVNRIVGGNPSEILGRLNANGQVYLINPSGILFGAGAQVNVGSLVASSLDLYGDPDSTVRRFSGTGQGSVVNQGMLRAIGNGQAGGSIALLGRQVLNQGVIVARLGSVALAAGNAITLSFADSSLINVVVEQSTFRTLVENRGIVIAEGGLVWMSSGARDTLLESLASNSGVVEARGLENRNGSIVLTSGAGAGTTTVSGTLDASSAAGKGGSIAIGGRNITLQAANLDASGASGGGSITVGGGFHGATVDGVATAQTVSVDAGSTLRAVSGQSGNGGQVAVWANGTTRFAGLIDGRATGFSEARGASAGSGGNAEVSGAGLLDYRGTTNLLSSRGATGNLLLDPYDITISSATGSNSSGFTATGNNSVINTGTLQNALNTANVTVSTGASGSQSGNITVTSPFSWNAATALTLSAAGGIAINAAITGNAVGSGLVLNAGAGQTISASGAINVGSFTLNQGNWLQNSATLPAFYAANFSIAGSASFLRAAGGNGTLASPWLLADIYGVQGMGSSAAYLAGNYALANPVDASTTSGWNAGNGFAPVGTTATPFTGSLNGQNNAIVNLTINRPTVSTGVGLFGSATNASLTNLMLLNESVTGNGNTGGLAGKLQGTSVVSGITTTGSVAGTNAGGVDNIGGIAGIMMDTASLSASSSAAAVSGYSYNAGGVVGVTNAGNTLTNVSASGAVSGSIWVGGLVGHNKGTIADAYATGAVTQLSGGNTAGGLVGSNDSGGKISRAYATGLVSGSTFAGNFAGNNTSTILASYWNSSTGARPAGIANGTTTGATGSSTAAMQAQASFVGWDFANTWFLTGGLNPTLRAGTTILGSASGNLTVSTGANSATVLNTTTLQNLLGAGNVLVAARNGNLTVSNAATWSSDSRLSLASSGNVAVNANLNATGAAGGLGVVSTGGYLNVTGAALATKGASLSLFAPNAGASTAITLTNTTLDSGSGSASILGSTASGTGIILAGTNSISTSNADGFSMIGTSRSGRGMLLQAGSTTTTSGNVSMQGRNTNGVGLAFCTTSCTTATNASVTSQAGNLSIVGTTSSDSGGGPAVDMNGQILTNAGSGNFTLSGFTNFSNALLFSTGDTTLNNAGTGTMTLNGTSQTKSGVRFNNAVSLTSSGNVTINALSADSSSDVASFQSTGDRTITNNSGNLTINGGSASATMAGVSVNGNLTLVNNGSGSIAINGSSGAGNGIEISGAATLTGSGSGAVKFSGAGAGTASNKDISIATTGAITLAEGSLSGTNGQGISIVSSAGAVSLSNQVLNTSNGALTVSGSTSDGSTAVTLTGVSIDTGSASGNVSGTSATGIGVSLGGNGTFTATGAGSVNITGTSGGTGSPALSFTTGATLTTSGTVNVTGNATTTSTTNVSALNLASGNTLTDLAGNLTVTANAGTARGVALNATLVNAGAGTLTVQGTSGSNNALVMSGTNNVSSTGAGSVVLKGTSSSGLATSTAGTLNFSASTATSSTSSITLQGKSSSGQGMTTTGTFNTSGKVDIIGLSDTSRAIDNGATYNNAANSTLAISGTTGLQAIRSNNTVINNYGDFSMTGVGGSNYGLYFNNGASFNNLGSGTFNLLGTTKGSDGIIFASATPYNFSGAVDVSGQIVSATGGQQGIRLDNGTVLNNTGQLNLKGSSLYANGLAVRFVGNSTLNNSGSMVLSGSNLAGGTGAYIAAGFTVNTSGGLTITDSAGATASNALLVDGTLATSAGTLAIAPASSSKVTIGTTGALSSTGAGDLILSTRGAGALTNNGSISQAGGGSGAITLSTVDGALVNAGTISGSATAGALTLRSTGAGTIDDSAGSISQAGTGAIALAASGSGAVTTGNVSYTNSNAGTLTANGNALVALAGTITSTGGALAVTAGSNGAQLALGSSIDSKGGDIVINGPVLLTAASTLDAGVGTLRFGGTIDGSQNLSAKAATIDLFQAAGATTALGAISLESANSLTLPSIRAASLLARSTGAASDLALASGTVLSASASGNAVTLAAGRNFINHAGAGAIVTSSGGRWLVYSGNPATDFFNDLDSQNTALWATSFSATPTLSQPGNRYVFALQPTLTIRSTDVSKTYGSDASTALASAWTVSGLSTGHAGAYLADTVAGSLSGSPALGSTGSAATAGVSGGPYAISVATGTLASTNNYALSYQSSGQLTVTPAALTASTNNANKTYDGSAYTGGAGVSYSGFVNAESAAVVAGTPSYAGTAQGAIDAGSYSLTGSGLSAANYTISYLPGTLTIVRAALGITVNSVSRTYDGLAHTAGAGVSYSGFVNGEDAAVLSGALMYGGSAQNGVNVGSYSLNASGLASSNYAITYHAGTLSITPAALVITPVGITRTYDGLAYSGGAGLRYSGLVNGETAAVISGTPVYGGSAQGAVNAGSYALTASGLNSPNYTISYLPGSLDIARAALTVTASNADKTYDGLAWRGGNGLQYSGFVQGDSAAVLRGTAVYGGSAQGAVDAGSYAILLSGLSAANYQISYSSGTLSVGQASLVVAASDVNRPHDGRVYSGGAGVRLLGLVNGDTSSVLTGSLAYEGSSQGALEPGKYVIRPFGLSARNYAIVFKPATLNITPVAASPDARDVTSWNQKTLVTDSAVKPAAVESITVEKTVKTNISLVACDVVNDVRHSFIEVRRCGMTGP